jgi:hypothetical protein
MSKTHLILINLIIFMMGVDLVAYKIVKNERQHVTPPVIVRPEPEPIPEPEPEPINYDITTPIPSFLRYSEMVAQFKTWEQEAPELAEVGTYGQSSKGTTLHYIRIRNKRLPETDNVVLITACIHGNEPLSQSTVTAYIGTLLDKYGDDDRITKLVDSRDIYFVPIVSPDSHPNSRHVDGVDPNRDWPTQNAPNHVSVPPVKAIQDLFLRIKPKAAASGHTSGRVFLRPWGDSRRGTPNDDDYRRIIGKMEELSGYGSMQGSQIYGRPIYGTDMDWFHRNGAFGIVIEYGRHQRVPSDQDTKTEFDMTWEAILYFIEEAPKVHIMQWSAEQWRTAA